MFNLLEFSRCQTVIGTGNDDDPIQLVNGKPDAMVRDAIFFEVISADLFRAIAGTNHRTALAGHRIVLLLFLELLQTRAQYAHRFFAVLDLRFFILHGDHHVRRQVGNANSGVGGVD